MEKQNLKQRKVEWNRATCTLSKTESKASERFRKNYNKNAKS